MKEARTTIRIQNLETDPCSSLMLQDLKTLLIHTDGVQSVLSENITREGEKYAYTFALNCLVSVGTSIIAAAIYDYLKSVFSRDRHPQDYQWKLIIQSSVHTRITVRQKAGIVSLDIQEEK